MPSLASIAVAPELIEQIARGDSAGVRARLFATLAAPPLVAPRGDYELNSGMRSDPARPLIPAAVLIPLVVRPEPTVLFTRRTPHLSRHAGQVSFPGGRVHAEDASLVRTALRETEEETGIAPEFVEVAGFLQCYQTGTGFIILPVVGLLRAGFTLLPDPNEVEEIFEVPLAFLLDSKNRERRSMEWQGYLREFYAFHYGAHYIWGATAGILVNFADMVCGT